MSSVTRRPATDADLPFLFALRREALGPYVVETYGAWDEVAEKRRFDEITHIADQTIIEVDGTPIGHLCLKHLDGELRLVRLFIRPADQNRGIGTSILREIIAQADRESLSIRLRVLRVNPARRLYERHRFAIVEESATHFVMVRRVDLSL
jgi:GNAT superfamily N-acetyltransferase